MTTDEKREVVRVLKQLVGPAFKAVLGRGDSTVNVAGRPGYVWCRKLGREELLITAYNRSGATTEGTTVLVRPRTLEGISEYEIVNPFEAADTATTLLGHVAQEPFDAHLNNPTCRVYRSTSQSIPDATWTAISFNAERWDTDNIWAVGDPTKLVCKTAGKYLTVGQIVFAANAAGLRILQIWKNTPIVYLVEESRLFIAADGVAGGTISTITDLAVNDYIRLGVYQNRGGALNVNSAAQISPEFMMVRVG